MENTPLSHTPKVIFQSHRSISDAAHRGTLVRLCFHHLRDEMWQQADSCIVKFPSSEREMNNAGVLACFREWGQERVMNHTGTQCMTPQTQQCRKRGAVRLPRAGWLTEPLPAFGALRLLVRWISPITDKIGGTTLGRNKSWFPSCFSPLAIKWCPAFWQPSLPPLLQEYLSITCCQGTNISIL